METMAALLGSRLPWKKPPDLALAIGIARKKVADIQRKRVHSEPDLANYAPTQNFGSTEVWGALSALESDYREVLTLRFYFGFTAKETAALMGRSPEAIDSLVQRARASFRALYGEDDIKENPCLTNSNP